MEKENRKGLIYEFPMGVAVLKGGHSLQIDIANAEFMKVVGHGECTREFDTLKSKKVPQSLEIGLFFCQIFIFII